MTNKKSSPSQVGQENARIDFIDVCRGVALLVIMVDHIELSCRCKALMWVTLIQFGLSDALDAFIFIAGVVFAIVHSRIQTRQGLTPSVKKALKRALQLHAANWLLFITVLCICLFSSRESKIAQFNMQFAMDDPLTSAVCAAFLVYQPVGCNILPLYTAILLIAPLQVWLAARSRVLLVVLSVTLYLFAITTSAKTGASTWTFDPLGWQLLFALGVLARYSENASAIRYPNWAFLGFLSIVFALMTFNSISIVQSARLFVNEQVLVGKHCPGVLRLLHFGLFAYVVTALATPCTTVMRNWRVFRALALTGRHALPVFLWGIILRYAGAMGLGDASVAETLALDSIGIAGAILIASLLDHQSSSQ